MSTRTPAKPRTQPNATPQVQAVYPVRVLTASAKLKVANAAALKAGLTKLFKTASPAMSWGFNAANDGTIGKLKAGPGLGTIDFDAKRVEVLALTPQTFPRPLTLNVSVVKGCFYVVDVYCKPSASSNFFATSNRTTTGGNYTTQYAMTSDSFSQHFVFVLQVHGSSDGKKDSYRLEIGADQPWLFEKIELTKVE